MDHPKTGTPRSDLPSSMITDGELPSYRSTRSRRKRSSTETMENHDLSPPLSPSMRTMSSSSPPSSPGVSRSPDSAPVLTFEPDEEEEDEDDEEEEEIEEDEGPLDLEGGIDEELNDDHEILEDEEEEENENDEDDDNDFREIENDVLSTKDDDVHIVGQSEESKDNIIHVKSDIYNITNINVKTAKNATSTSKDIRRSEFDTGESMLERTMVKVREVLLNENGDLSVSNSSDAKPEQDAFHSSVSSTPSVPLPKENPLNSSSTRSCKGLSENEGEENVESSIPLRRVASAGNFPRMQQQYRQAQLRGSQHARNEAGKYTPPLSRHKRSQRGSIRMKSFPDVDGSFEPEMKRMLSVPSDGGAVRLSVREGEPIVIGVCAMDKKAKSKYMKAVLRGMTSGICQGLFHVVIFGNEVILNKNVEDWPICHVLMSWTSGGFPLAKAEKYARLRKPLLVNDLSSQNILLDRRKVYKTLEKANVPTPKYLVMSRDKPREEWSSFVEEEDYI
eukprot:g4705.t1